MKSSSTEATSLDFSIWMCIFFWMLLLHGCWDSDDVDIRKLNEKVVKLEVKVKQLEKVPVLAAPEGAEE